MTYKWPETVYHYTNKEGIYGILDSQSIWATHYKFLNDSDEIHHILCILEPLLSELSKEPKKSKEYTIAKRVDGVVKEAFGIAGSTPWFDIYIASFCKEKDLLSQWRGYGGDGGYAIGMNYEQLKEHSKKESAKYQWKSVTPWHAIYDDKTKHEYIREKIDDLCSKEYS